ncbi:MAG: hypothetical protein HY901_14665 [Deltaproteobacteria bacterium]|nr:hypothetical protein [Deltaproteobacteria bacterium]
MGARGWVVFLAGAGVSLGACQNQQFYRVDPNSIAVGNTVVQVLGKPEPPNIMLVVDRSFSMTESVTGTGLRCTDTGTDSSPYDARSTNPCKWNDLKVAFADPQTGFLTTSQGLARFGLLPFPAATGACDHGQIVVPIGVDPQPIRDQLLNRLIPGGGTPTAATMLEAAKDPLLAIEEPNRKRFVMLLTDGLPNCNPGNAALCAQCRADANACSASGGCHPTDPPFNSCGTTPFDGASCLDEIALVDAVHELRGKGIDTFVIGFGKDTSGTDANRVLSGAAIAGGHARQNAPTQYYQANTVQDLRTFLEEILQRFPCTFSLDPVPSDGSLVEVSVEDSVQKTITSLKSGVDWKFATDTLEQVQLLGSWCTDLQNADANRFTVRVKYVSLL